MSDDDTGIKRVVSGGVSTGRATFQGRSWSECSPHRGGNNSSPPAGQEGSDLLPANRDARTRLIVAYTRAHGRAEVSDLAVQLGVAQETVRRDLTALEEQGLVRRAHGVAYPVDNAAFETSMDYRSSHLVPDKRRIAAAAVELIGAAATIYLDDGFTPHVIAQELTASNRSLTVVTPSILVASTLAMSDQMSVIMLGGDVRRRTLGTVGHWVTDMLATLLIDVAILGANGISRERGLTTPLPAVSDVKTKVLAHSRRNVFVGVHTKFGVDSFSRFAEVSDLHTLVTDRGLSNHEARRYAELGPRVIRV
jgi:DeoR family fructose operon transcriptional repressor